MGLYIDDSGTRHPDRRAARAAHGFDWFSLGGVLLKQEDEQIAREAHVRFMGKWNLDPDVVFLHSAEIRRSTGHFTWLKGLTPEKRAEFIEDLYQLMAQPPFVGFACVIDRPGYNARYAAMYGAERWTLCKTAFSVLVERAAKYAMAHGYKLKVFVEKSDRDVDSWMRGYYDHLCVNGMPFSSNMDKYGPLTAEQLRATLYDFKTKAKSSAMMQMADLYLWPMSIGGYHRGNVTYARLVRDAKLIDCQLAQAEIPALGIKYSCFENVAVRP